MMMERGEFREDLFFRLTYHIEIPPLRERRDDLPLLIDYFLKEQFSGSDQRHQAATSELTRLLSTYRFPGNVRELHNMIERALRTTVGREAFLRSLRDYVKENSVQGGLRDEEILFPKRLPTLQETESSLIAEALRRTGGNQRAAADLIDLSPSALSRRLKKETEAE
jgi:transcriptional regulator with PAS, ATPase and Fis domain